jgi:hypothetical protein
LPLGFNVISPRRPPRRVPWTSGWNEAKGKTRISGGLRRNGTKEIHTLVWMSFPKFSGFPLGHDGAIGFPAAYPASLHLSPSLNKLPETVHLDRNSPSRMHDCEAFGVTYPSDQHYPVVRQGMLEDFAEASIDSNDRPGSLTVYRSVECWQST